MSSVALPALRPMGVGELLDRSVRLYRRNFFRLVGTLAIVLIPLDLLTLLYTLMSTQFSRNTSYTTPETYDFSALGSFLGLSLVVSLFSLIVYQGLGTAATTRAVVDDIMGTPSGPIDTYRKIGRTWGKMLTALLLLVLLIIALSIWAIIPCVGWLSGPGIVTFISMVMMPLVAPVVVIEQRGGRASIRRAWDLARRRFWPVVGFMLVLSIFVYIITFVPSSAVSSAVLYLLRDSLTSVESATISTVIQSVSSMLISLISTPLQFIAITLLYFDLRVRTEGLDMALEMGSETAHEQNDLHTLLASNAPEPEATSLITGKDVGNFVLITLAFLGIYFVFVVVAMVIGLAAYRGI